MGRRVLLHGKYLRFLEMDGWEYVERTNADCAVMILALTEEGNLRLVEQYRPAVGRRVIELPAGLVGGAVALVVAVRRRTRRDTA